MGNKKFINRKKKERNFRGLIANLAISDLLHEWILSLCLIMAVTAVLSPLLILFGLKFGVIGTLRDRLISDPRNREIRPMISKSFDQDWFDRIIKRPDVSFVIPKTRQISASVDVKNISKDNLDSLVLKQIDIIPTARGDNLLIENGVPVPEPGECVLTYISAKKLNAKKGSLLTIYVNRRKNNKYQSANLEMSVAGVLPQRANGLAAIYVTLDILEAVEQYKDGMAVTEYGWQGSFPKAYIQFDGLIIIPETKLTPTKKILLTNNTGFTEIKELTKSEFYKFSGYKLESFQTIYLLTNRCKQIKQENIDTINYQLREEKMMIIPWVDKLRVYLTCESNIPIMNLILHSLPILYPEESAISIMPQLNQINLKNETMNERIITVPKEFECKDDNVNLNLEQQNNTISFPVKLLKNTDIKQEAFLPANLAGILNLSKQRHLTYDSQIEEFIIARHGYAGFRLYAATIDDVGLLKSFFEKNNIPVNTEAERIQDVTELNKYLTIIFWLIAAVGIVGGMAFLLSSLYAAVERKKKELGVLRLLGISGSLLFRFPIYQSIFITSGGFCISFGFFWLVEIIINELFKKSLLSKESLCFLSFDHFVITYLSIVFIAILAGAMAAWRTTCIEPAEAIRDE